MLIVGQLACNSVLVWPSTEHNVALYEDTRAWRIVRELAPPDTEPSAQSHQHHTFVNAATAVFSIQGYYARILELGVYPVNNHTLVHYPFLTDNLSHYQLAAWFALHGVQPTGEDITCLEGFFRSRRHRLNRDRQPGGDVFNNDSFPQRPADIVNIVGVPHWTQLRFGDVAPGQLTEYTTTPGIVPLPPTTPSPAPADPPMIIDTPGTVLTAVSVLPAAEIAAGNVEMQEVPVPLGNTATTEIVSADLSEAHENAPPE